MADNMSDYLENALLDMVLNNASWTALTSVYVALYTTAPTDSTAGTEVTNANGYQRQTMTGGWTISGTATRAYNTSAITFPTCNTASWGTVTSVAITTSGTHASGEILFYGDLTTSRTVNVDDIFSFPANSLGITLT